MQKKSNSSWDKRDEEIAQLKAELELAYNLIAELKQEYSSQSNQESNLEIRDSLLKQPHIIKRRLVKHKKPLNNISLLQFLIIITVVATGLSSFIMIVNHLSTNKSQEQPAKLSTKPTLTYTIPIQPKWAIAKTLPIPLQKEDKQLSIVYNLQTPPNFKQSQELQNIVDDVVFFTTTRGLPKKPLSISLIDVNTGEAAGYQQNTLRFPASVVKMFWMVVLYAQIENGIWKNQDDFNPYIAKMIDESDNEAASFIIDQITNAHSLPITKGEKFDLWRQQREKLNLFFEKSAYQGINISQKTFPIPYLKLSKPEGTDLQLRQNSMDSSKPIRNKISTEQASRLLYEICYKGEAISPEASLKMCNWLKRDLYSKQWLKEPPDTNIFNPIRAFFGDYFTRTDIQLYSKAGWTSGSRQEVALIATPDGKTKYILAIFGDDQAYANDYKIFPKLSRLVYERMDKRSPLK